MPKTFNRRYLWMLLLGFVSGFPLLFSSTILKTWLIDQGGNLYQVGAISVLALPYSICFLWAPLIDYIVACKIVSRKMIIICSLLCYASVLYYMGDINPKGQFGLVMLFGSVLGFLGSTQDHVIEAYRMMVLTQQEREQGVSWSFVGFRLALTTVGGLGLFLAGQYGWLAVYRYSAFVLLCLAAMMMFSPDDYVEYREVTFNQHMIDCVRWIGGVFAKKYRISFLLTHRLSVFWLEAMLPVFLMFKLGFDESKIGMIYMMYAMPGMIFGSVLMSRCVQFYKVSKLLCRCIQVQLVLYILLAIFCHYTVPLIFIFGFVFIEGCVQGLLSTLSAVWLIGETDEMSPTFGFSVWYGLGSLGRVVVGPIAALVIQYYGGWVSFALTGALVAFISSRVAQHYFEQDMNVSTEQLEVRQV